MIQDGRGGSETPQTNIGDPTFLTNNNIDYEDIEEHSLGSPLKDKYSFLPKLEDGRRGRCESSTPRDRAALNNRRNLPGLGAGEFTPMLKNATRNSALRNERESIFQTPGFLKVGSMEHIPEDLSPLPPGSSIYGDSRIDTYFAGTPALNFDYSSNNSTPKAQSSRNKGGPDFAEDKKPSLREQESLINKLQKENFGLKLGIVFMQENMQKASPDYNEALIKENTELKVERVTTQKELSRCRKSLKAAKLDLEAFRKQFTEFQESVKQRQIKENGREEISHLNQVIEKKANEIIKLKNDLDQVNDVRHKVYMLKTGLEEKNRHLKERDKEIENLKKEAEKRDSELHEYRTKIERSRRQLLEVEEKSQENEDLHEALKKMENEIEYIKDKRDTAVEQKERAEANLQELQEEMVDKSFHTKGFNRQIEEKASRLQNSLEETKEKCYTLEKELADRNRESQKLSDSINKLSSDYKLQEQKLEKRINSLEREKEFAIHERDSLSKSYDLCQKEHQRLLEDKRMSQSRYDALTIESSNLQRDLRISHNTISDLEEKLEHEKVVGLQNEQRIRDNYKAENDLLSVEIEHLKTQLQEKKRSYEDAYDKVVCENQDLQSQKELSDERAAGMQRMIEKLHETEGSLSDKEAKLQQALQSEMERHQEKEAALTRQVAELSRDIQVRQQTLSNLKLELTTLEEDLRLSQREQESLLEKIEGLEDEVEVLQTNLDEETEELNREKIAAKQESEDLRHELQSIKLNLAKAESAASNAKAEMDKFRLTQQTGEGTNDRLNTRLEDVEVQLNQARQETSSLKDQLNTAEADLRSLRRSKVELEHENKEMQGHVQHLQAEIKTVSARDVASKGPSMKRELATSKSQIVRLESRIRELETQLAKGDDGDETHTEISMLRRDLQTAREKDTEYAEREAKQKDVVRALKRQITALERKAHHAELSRFTKSPQTPADYTTLTDEVMDLRSKLAGAHQSMKDLRSQLKTVERDANRRVAAVSIEMETRSQAWEMERYELEHSHHQVQLAKEILDAKHNAAELSITRLRSKIDRLQQAIEINRRPSPDENRCLNLNLDHHDTYPDHDICDSLPATDPDLRAKLKRLRDERVQLHAQAAAFQEQLAAHQRRFRLAQDAWETERRQLTHGVRFANVSSSLADDTPLVTLQRESEAREKLHVKEMRGVTLQLEWLRAKCRREEFFRAEAAFAKRFMGLQIAVFEACNQADIQLLQRCGVKRPPLRPRRPVTIKRVGSVIRAIIRMKRGAQLWAEKRKIEEKLKEQMSRQRKMQQQEIAQRNFKVLAGSGKKMIEA